MQTKTLFTVLFVAFALAIGVYSDATPKTDLEAHVLTLLSKWRQGALVTSLFTLPSIKSIGLEPLNINYKGSGIEIEVTATDVSLTGVDGFVIDSINVEETAEYLDVSGVIKFPKITLFSDNYKLSGRAVILPIRGNGDMTIDVLDVSVPVSIRIANVNGESTKVEDVQLSYKIGGIKAKLEKSTLLVNDLLSSSGPGILEGFQGELVTTLKDWAIPLADSYLAKVALPELTEIIADLAITSTVQV